MLVSCDVFNGEPFPKLILQVVELFQVAQSFSLLAHGNVIARLDLKYVGFQGSLALF